MKFQTTFKCLHCNEEQRCDHRNRGRQGYCAEPVCRRAAKAASQRRWLSRPENENYFRGKGNSERVREWRKAHPGYWRKKKAEPGGTLQDPCPEQIVDAEVVEASCPRSTLQDLCIPQLALFVGLISAVTGHALQEDIVASARAFLNRGEDILRMVPGTSAKPPVSNNENQTHSVPRTPAARASPV